MKRNGAKTASRKSAVTQPNSTWQAYASQKGEKAFKLATRGCDVETAPIILPTETMAWACQEAHNRDLPLSEFVRRLIETEQFKMQIRYTGLTADSE